MNDANLPETDEIETLEERLKSLRPTEVPDFVQARLQFELGRRQGRRDARRATLAYASAACVLTWFASTSKVFRNETAVMNPDMSNGSASNLTRNDNPEMVWTTDEVRRFAREIEMPTISVTRLTAKTKSVRESSKISSQEAPPKEGWDRRRWYLELLEESLPKSG